jgi:replicative DNA helicase
MTTPPISTPPDQRIPPHDEAAERALLGCLLLPGDSHRVADACTDRGLETEAFYVPAHGLIWRCVKYLHTKRVPPDAVSVSDALRKHGALDQAGGEPFLNKLIDDCPTPAHAEYYLELVLEKWLARRGVESARELEAGLMAGTEPPRDVLAHALAGIGTLAGTGETADPTKAQLWATCKDMARAAKHGVPRGLPSPWPTFDSRIGGAEFGGVTLLVGGSKTRKSYLVHQWGLHAAVLADPPIPGAYFAFEDRAHRALDRAVCALAGVNCWAWEQGRYSDEDLPKLDAAAARIQASPYSVRDRRGLSLARRRLEIARGVSRDGWRFVVLDAFKDMEPSGGDPREEAKLMCWMTDVSGEFGLAMIVVHHVNKQAGARRKNETAEERKMRERLVKFDVRGSTRITDDPRMIVALQCQALRAGDGRVHYGRYVLDVIARNYGPTGAISLWLDQETGMFQENPNVSPFSDWKADGEGEAEYWKRGE